MSDETTASTVHGDRAGRRIGPQAPTLIQQLIQGMHFDLTVAEMARGQYYIHPALPEVVEQALLEL